MKTDEIKLLYEYTFWADRRMLAATAKVSPEQYVAPTQFGVAYGSLRGALIHALDGMRGWRIICQKFFVPRGAEKGAAEQPDVWGQLTESSLSTFDQLNQRWRTEEREMRSYVGTLTDGMLEGVVRYAVGGGIVRERPLWQCLFHAQNHATQHRSESAALVTSYGQSPGDMDFTLFLNEYLKLQAEV